MGRIRLTTSTRAVESLNKPEESKMDGDIRNWSDEQSAIFAWFQNPDPKKHNLVVRARAGTGKTTTILEAINRAPERRILLAAFNKIIAEELQSRMRNPAAESKTLHALGYSYLRRMAPKARVENGRRKWQVAEVACGRGAPQAVLRCVAELHTKAREIKPHLVEQDPGTALVDLGELALEYQLTLPADAEDLGRWTDEQVAHAALTGMEIARDKVESIDFADMIYLPIVHKLVEPRYDLVCVDEAQDMSAPQLEIAQKACKRGGRIAVIGDDRQCQPRGTLVDVPGGFQVPIEKLRDGDAVVAWDRHSTSLVGQRDPIYKVRVGRRPYKGRLLTVSSAGFSTRCTPDHKWAVKFGSRSTDQWAVYLMKRGEDYRLGWCQMFDKNGGLHLGVRTRLEKADCAWILSVHASKAEASRHESLTAARYGLPLVQFKQSIAAPNAGLYTQAWLDAFWLARRAQGDHSAQIDACLADHGRLLAHPFYTATRQRQGRTTIFVTHACNLLPGMLVPLRSNTFARSVTWSPIEISEEEYRGFVYSLEVPKHPYYVADGIITHNCIYGWRGADTSGIDRMKRRLGAVELGLKTTYRCPRNVVEKAKELVPDFVAHVSAPEGVVREVFDAKDTLMAEAQPGDFVLSRTNAPLVPLCIAMLKQNKLARIRGRDLSAGLKRLVQSIEHKGARTLADLRVELPKRIAVEVDRIDKRVERGEIHQDAAEQAIGELLDNRDVILALADEIETFAELYERFDRVFTGDDYSAVVMFSTVHRAKGLEADRVWLLEKTFRKARRGDVGASDWREGAEEANIRYVAITRAKRELVWLKGDLE